MRTLTQRPPLIVVLVLIAAAVLVVSGCTAKAHRAASDAHIAAARANLAAHVEGPEAAVLVRRIDAGEVATFDDEERLYAEAEPLLRARAAAADAAGDTTATGRPLGPHLRIWLDQWLTNIEARP